MSSVIKIAIVGCGQIVTHHIKALGNIVSSSSSEDNNKNSVNEIRIIALCDPSSERRAIIANLCIENNLIPSENDDNEILHEFDSLDELLTFESTNTENDNVLITDAIFIAVPHHLHVPIASLALKAGKNVVLEKPLAPSIESCRVLQFLSEQSKGMLIVAEQSPFWQEIKKAKELVSSGEIGELVTASSYYYESMRDNVTSGTDEEGNLGWRASLDKCGGGIVIDGGLHWIRPLREVCGDITRVFGVMQNREKGLKMEDAQETLAHAIFEIEQHQQKEEGDSSEKTPMPSLMATFSANMMHTAPMAHSLCPYFRFTGTKGELVVPGNGLNPNGGGGLILFNEEFPDEGKSLFPTDRQGGFFLGFQGLWENIITILKNEDKQLAKESVIKAARDVGVAKALYKSTQTKQFEYCEMFQS